MPSATFRSPPPRKWPAVCKPAVLFAVEFGARHPSRLALALDQRAAHPSPTAVNGGHAAPCACPHGRCRRTEAGVAGSGEALQGGTRRGVLRGGACGHTAARAPGGTGGGHGALGRGGRGSCSSFWKDEWQGGKSSPHRRPLRRWPPASPLSLPPWVSRHPTRVPGPGTERKRCSQDPRLQARGSWGFRGQEDSE